MASKLLQVAQNAARASRAAAVASSRAAASARAAAAHATRAARLAAALDPPVTKRRDDAPGYYDYEAYAASGAHDLLPDDVKFPTDKDLESDEATWALYERWCKAHNKERPDDHPDKARRFKLFRYFAKSVHHDNTYLPSDPKKAAIYIRKRKLVKSLLSKGKDVSDFDEHYLPTSLGPFADGGEPDFNEIQKGLLKVIEERDAVQDH